MLSNEQALTQEIEELQRIYFFFYFIYKFYFLE